MDIKELNKKQLILVTLLITFIVSIATGIVTVSLMQKMPKSVPQTINNVIQRTIEKVTTIQVPTPIKNTNEKKENNQNEGLFVGVGNVLVSIYGNKKIDLNYLNTETTPIDTTEIITPVDTNTETIPTDTTEVNTPITNSTTETTPIDTTAPPEKPINESSVDISKKESLGQGIIISDVGLVLVDSKILKGYDSLKVTLNKIDFDLSILKKFSNGFTVLKIQTKLKNDIDKKTKKIDN